jgi:hypothetical protein
VILRDPEPEPVMDTFYLICAALGGTILVLQVVAGMFGIGGEHDTDTDTDTDTDHDAGVDGDHDGNWLFGALSVRTAAAALTFFGLGGLTAEYYGASEPASMGVAIGSAAAAFYAVAFLIRSLMGLKADGTVRIDRTIGSTGSVYLRIPGSKSGLGKVHLAVQKRTVEFQAMTAGPELPTGAPVRVVAVVNSDTVEVEAA